MSTDTTHSSATVSSRSSSPRPPVPPSPSSEIPPSPSSDFSQPNPFFEPPTPETTSYNVLAVGLGILAPQPISGPFAAMSPAAASMSFLRNRPSPVLQRLSSSLASDLGGVTETPAGPTSPLAASPLSSRAAYFDPVLNAEDASPSTVPTPVTDTAPASGLHIPIPPSNLIASTSTPSPPLLPPPTDVPLPLATGASPITQASPSRPQAPVQAQHGGYFNADDTSFPIGPSYSAPTGDPAVDFTEFDADGLSALEKIYLFSRSLAAFHRVFIVHALPRYLGAEDTVHAASTSQNDSERITPAEAVEYVLPLLNGLALDDDEAVKEALAAELLSIIWWFITRCRLVEDEGTDNEDPMQQDAPEQGADATLISVQTFTPILGTLLLSQNPLVGGPARHAVVELLKRVWRANEREAGRSPVLPVDDNEVAGTLRDYDTHLLGPHERGLFEREIVHQVVIGMGRLDVSEGDDGPLSTISTPRSGDGRHHEHYEQQYDHPELHRSSSYDRQYPTQTPPATAPDSSTAGSTPLAPPPGVHDSYFPTMPITQEPSSIPAVSPSAAHVSAQPYSREQSPFHAVIGPPTFTLSQPPASPLRAPQAVLSPPVSTAPVHSPTTLVSPPPPARSDDQLTDLLSEPETTPSSSSGSITSTPSLTSSTSTSTNSLSSPHLLRSPTGSATSSTEQGSVSSGQICAAPAESSHIGDVSVGEATEAADVVMADAGWVPESPRQRALDLRLDLSHSNGQAVAAPPGLGSLPAPVEEQEIPISQEGHNVSTWLSTGLPEGDVSMQDISGSGEDEGEGDISEEAAVGRLSSMSLMAAVTASGTVRDETKRAFVTEVERVGRDPVYWVRREATFAVGALAKVVPDELVVSSLLPLFETLYQDDTWHVRQSVLFALPAILSRLPPKDRRSLALKVVLPLSLDESPTVRSAVLESLGEVMHTFASDEGGPPRELLDMFLGVRDLNSGSTSPTSPVRGRRPFTADSAISTISLSSEMANFGSDANAESDIYSDPARTLVCAFNLPAVALTLGRQRWPELCDLYRTLVQNPSYKVRRTLAASLGEIAKIIGPEYAKEDLMDVWRASIGAEETEVRLKAAECMIDFVRAIGEPERAEVVRGLQEDFQIRLKGWREREEVVKSLAAFLDMSGIDESVLLSLLMTGLADRVSAIREAAVTVSTAFVRAWEPIPHLISALRKRIRALAHSDSYRERTTFLSCEQAILLSENRGFILLDEEFWEILSKLSRDSVVDVRIRVARLLSLIYEKNVNGDGRVMARVLALAERLEKDSSQDVQAFARAMQTYPQYRPTQVYTDSDGAFRTFSRPPPPQPS